ncbi:uncharacterized protein M6B38_335890 [Iris pallida]|uniref:Uncharacterized protein n=1 Tax=Iris pallida TaxID=29817 RepID=A0AAX6H0R7_IRIPA|nr:uncharacterized protein M6B38_335890 [Iris pallida]
MGCSLLPLFLFLFTATLSIAAPLLQQAPISGGEGVGVGGGLVPLRRFAAEDTSTPVRNTSFILAAQRTLRKDPTDGFKLYNGGWNISEGHYWASVGFTAFPLFTLAIVWFVGFGLTLLLICCCYCCCPRRSYSYSRVAYALSLILLILFTIAAIIGCIVLYTGQGKFHSSTSETMDYVTGQADFTVENLRNFSGDLSAAKKVGVDQVFLPADTRAKIDEIVTKVNASANKLDARTSDNSNKIKDVLNTVRMILVVVAAVMLLLAFLGFLLSIFGLQSIVYILVFVGWILVAGTFILCGVFLIFHNVVADTCVSMEEWVENPTEQTALDDILPCVDVATANASFYQSKLTTFQLVNVVNQVITNVANRNIPPALGPPLYYNQSGPLMPTLCNPYNSDLSNHTCTAGQVALSNASQVWQGFVCTASMVSGAEVCTSVGRITPNIYKQMDAAVSMSFGLHHYGPFLAQLEDCTFVRQTFSDISANNCPGLRKYSYWIYVGLAMVSAAVMLSLIFWVIYARERRHRRYNKESKVMVQDKGGFERM